MRTRATRYDSPRLRVIRISVRYNHRREITTAQPTLPRRTIHTVCTESVAPRDAHTPLDVVERSYPWCRPRRRGAFHERSAGHLLNDQLVVSRRIIVRSGAKQSERERERDAQRFSRRYRLSMLRCVRIETRHAAGKTSDVRSSDRIAWTISPPCICRYNTSAYIYIYVCIDVGIIRAPLSDDKCAPRLC